MTNSDQTDNELERDENQIEASRSELAEEQVGAEGTSCPERASHNEQTENEDEDAFFAKSFSLGASRNESEHFDQAFAGGLRELFDATDDESEWEEEEPVASELDVSDAERVQRDLELERREALDATILQNDADFLYEAGAKYEAPRVSDEDFDKNIRTSGAGRNADDAVSPTSDDAGESPFRRRALVRPESIIEAMLFVGDRENKPLPIARMCELIRNLSEQEALEVISDLNARYDREGAPYKIIEDGDGYRLVLRSEFDDTLARFMGKPKEFKLSQTAIDVLALVAYRQPISHDEILEIRSSGANALSQLVKRELLAVEKKVVDGKKTAYYRTTDRFLKLFHLNSIDDLPIIGDVDYR